MKRYEDIFSLLEEYDMFARTVEMLKEPNVYRAVTPYGTYVCKRSAISPAKWLQVTGILRHVQKSGWNGAIPIAYTKYDEPYVQRDNRLYYVTRYHAHVSYPFPTIEEVARWGHGTAQRLAELHYLTQQYRFDDPRQVEPLLDSLMERWQRIIGQLDQHAESARIRTFPSPFDGVFLANHAFLRDAAQRAVYLLDQWKERHRTYAHFRLALNHGAPHPAHTLMFPAGEVRFINFDHAVFDNPVRDLSAFFRSFFGAGGDQAAASEVFHRYVSLFPLKPDELELWKAMLTFPERVMRDIDAYYSAKKDWNELYAVRRLEKVLDRYIQLSRWIEPAF